VNLIATVTITHPDLALTPTIRSGSAEEIRVLPQSATDPETAKFFFLVEGADGGFEARLDEDATVAEWTLVADSSPTRVYRISHPEWTKLISPKTVELGGLVHEAVSTERGWSIRLQLPDRKALVALSEFCDEEGINFELKRMFRQDGWVRGEPTGLTDAQRDALLAAYENGYFEEPREASLADLAEVLGISPTAVGGRIRRGTAELVEMVLLEE
jgi:predicted DNA binding protein